ncbi:hypothetical protein SAMD00019534_059470 [Acytostelium subglobosum LB1]|uniref:hypothetical protein n=1 Tax=Acytostelium subglobosum LB1 TaxID=1410327 RepID=UPI0006448A6E|nr:hypothetical protein SAMD00019534_059470 [Acytostelium subglobosum LB1]GAM22772.1 hypothetical protein SAMD00019534_059470 [Acytostelium subglobosum LB1]|eukprot:XP_012753999.1 hypothetical protein SAMD00019534_059470 [Acytostelium subglobosum LB1]
MVQEHKIKTPINDQMSHIQSTINNILKEIKDINHIINKEHPIIHHLYDVDGDHRDEVDMSKVIESIISCSSVDQYIKDNMEKTDNRSPDMVKLNDDELLKMINRHIIEYIDQMPYDVVATTSLQAYQVNINADKFIDIRKQIESCFKLIEPLPHLPRQQLIPHKYDNHIMTLKANKCSFFSLATSEWTSIDRAFNRSIEWVSTSVVYTRGNVFVFGGKDPMKEYTRYSLADGQSHDSAMYGIDGGDCISACYDGDHHIYIIGGYDNGVYLDRVDCMDIDTQLFKQVGRLPYPLAFPFTFIHDGSIIIVGGTMHVLL